MQIGRRTIMAAGTFLLAAATGHVMQNGSAIEAKLRGSILHADQNAVTDASLTSADGAPAALPAAAIADPEAIARALPTLPDFPGANPRPLASDTGLALRISRSGPDLTRPATAADREYDTFGQLCAEPELTLTPLRSALLGLAFSAPCHANERIEISHAGLAFAVRTDAEGRFSTTIPAMAASGAVTMRPERGPALHAAEVVADLGAVNRFALSTRGQAGLHLNAYPQASADDGTGPLRPNSPGLPTLGHGGFLTLLGDPTLDRPMLAEIVTTPANQPHPRSEIIATVDGANCGRDLLATTFTLQGSVLPTPGAVSFAMPDCSAIGDQLVMDVDMAATAVAMASAQK